MPGSPFHLPDDRRGPHSRGGPFSVLCLIAVLCVSVYGAKQAAAPAPATTVGSDTCSACHEDISKSFQKNPHAAVEKDKRRGWEGKACESCHGPGSVHAESADKKDIRNPGALPVVQADKICLSCHLNQPTQIGRLHGSHARTQVSCTSCHPVHKPESGAMTPRQAPAVNKLCQGCHTQEWAAFQRPHAHNLNRGAMSCVDCHNPHGSLLPGSMRAISANELGCFKCHGDKRGPFAYEHASVRLQGCTACHEPHGSANPRMLTRHEVRFVCLECHANKPAASVQALPPTLGGIPPAFHDLNSPRYRNCTLCHVKIHGSHINRALLR
ncbi:MAG: DmsE family decaheme c-type cytochrome [Bryobacteraceae bacterium]